LLVFSTFFAQKTAKVDSFFVGMKIKDFSIDKNSFWLASEGNGIIEFSPSENTWKTYSSENGKLSNDIFYAISQAGKYVFVGSIDGLFIFDKRKKRWSKRKFSIGGQLGNYIRSIEYDEKNKTMWIGRFQFLTQYNMKKRRFENYDLTQNNDNKSNSVTKLKVIDENLWVGTENGLFSIPLEQDYSEKLQYNYFGNSLNYFPNSGEKISISAIMKEKDNYWFGCNEFRTKENPEFNLGGFYKYDGMNSWLKIDKNTGINADGISDAIVIGNFIFVAVYEFDKNKKQIYGRGLNLINRSNGKIIKISSDYLPEQINKIHYLDGNLWLASDNGLFKMQLENKFFNWEN